MPRAPARAHVRVAAVAISLLALGALLPGCASRADPPAPDALQQSLEAVEVQASATMGSIRGVVVDEAIRPVPRAQVRMEGRNATADGQGRFVLTDVAPGTHFVQASAAGFLPVQSSALVEAGKVADLRIALAADPSPTPFHDVLKFKGFIQASAGIATYAADLFGNETGVSFCSCTLYFQLDPTVRTVVYEAQWTEALPPPTGPSQFYWEVEGVNAENIQSAYGNSPVLQHLPATEWPNVTNMQARLTGPAEWVESNQEYQMFVTLFHQAEAPKGWSLVKGDL
jgi:hypothetical protein